MNCSRVCAQRAAALHEIGTDADRTTKGDTGNRRAQRPFGRTQVSLRRGRPLHYKTVQRCSSITRRNPLSMSTTSSSSTPMQTVNEQLTAVLETTAQKAFPGGTQSELRREFLSALLIIAKGSSATDSQLDNFLVRNGEERICIVADCGQRFKRRDRSRDHIRMHLDYRPYGCDGQCGKPKWCVLMYSSASPLIAQ